MQETNLIEQEQPVGVITAPVPTPASFRLSCTVGLRVFVCENLAFHGEYTPGTMFPNRQMLGARTAHQTSTTLKAPSGSLVIIGFGRTIIECCFTAVKRICFAHLDGTLHRDVPRETSRGFRPNETLEVDVGRQSKRVHVRGCGTGIVVVLIVGLESETLPDRYVCAKLVGGFTPVLRIAVVEDLSLCIW